MFDGERKSTYPFNYRIEIENLIKKDISSRIGRPHFQVE